MAAPSTAAPLINCDPGYLFWAPLGSTPTDSTSTSVTASKFSNDWVSPWLPLGATVGGSTWHYNLTVANVEAAELFDPVAIRTTGRSATIDFSLEDFVATKLAYALNGATKTVTGSTTTTSTKVTPPQPGTETRFMLGWESTDRTLRAFAYQCINSGDIAMQFQKAPNATAIPFTVNCEISSTYLVPWEFYSAGVARG